LGGEVEYLKIEGDNKGGESLVNKIVRWILTLLGGVTALLLFNHVVQYYAEIGDNVVYYIGGLILSFIFGGFVVFLISPIIIRFGRRGAIWIETELSKVPTSDIISGSIGLIIGLLIAFLISRLLMNIPIPFVGMISSVLAGIFLAYLGVSLATKRGRDLPLFNGLFGNTEDDESKGIEVEDVNSIVTQPCPKILDTSVIIDGRIADICRTKFLEGPLVIPEFVLEELRHVADSSASLKRNRGRRGLDILNIIQKEIDIEVKILDHGFEQAYEENLEVDVKLLKLAQQLGGKVITNDYNLNKIAEFQGVPVLNINELANAVKPVVLPGEEMEVEVIKDGKEAGQGLAYLDDGTMIVVESGRKHIGKTIDVMVTSVLQTAAGRMIFAKPKGMEGKSA